VAYGVAGLRHELVSTVGLPTELPPLNGLPLVGFEDLVLGGHDVCLRDLSSSAGELVRAGILSADLVAAASAEAAAFEAAIRPGVLDPADTGFADLDSRAADRGSLPPRDQVAHLVGDLEEFSGDHDLARTVVVHVASTEAEFAPQPAWESLEALEAALDAGVVNVLAWQGYNMLGNRDGEVLKEPAHKAKKLKTKDEALRSILEGSSPELSTQVGIDYVPSLGDWKTAMDFVHFEGFLGAKMSLQFTWSGCDSALAAPLIIDLARLAELANRRGESGALEHLAGYFKAPLGDDVDHDFHRQMELLHRYANDIE